MKVFLDAVKGETDPPPAPSYFASTRATIGLAESLRTGKPVQIGRTGVY
jgi:hypothetical protein